MAKSPKIRVTRTGRRLVLGLIIGTSIMCNLSSCNVTRRVTTESSFYQRGDTTCTIVTKTTETYDAKKQF